MKLKLSLFAASALAVAAPSAHAYEGLYGSIGAGLSYFGYENDVSNDGAGGSGPVSFDSDSDYDNGIGIYSALGYAFGNGFRGELEYSYRRADIDQIDPADTNSIIPADGESTIHSVMANGFYDFEDVVASAVTPYIGAGVGLGFVDHDIAATNATGSPTSPLSVSYGDSRVVPAYQAIAGMAIDLAPQLKLDLSYRYHGVFKRSFDGTLNGAPATILAGSNSHNMFAGLRWDFGASAAPATVEYKDCWDGSSVPVTAECPVEFVEQQTGALDPLALTVYFGYDKCNLTPEASSLISSAASRALEANVETAIVQGNTDRSGSFKLQPETF